MPGFTSEGTSNQRCTTTARFDRIEAKLDIILQKLGETDTLKNFGVNLLANAISNVFTAK